MKILRKILSPVLAIAMCISFAGCSNGNNDSDKESSNGSSNDEKSTYNVVASFYPMHVLTMNLTNGIDGVKLTSMSDPNMGCIHDHTFSTDDLKKVENADVYVENGLGLEVFNDKIKDAYPDTAIIEASTNIKDYVKDHDDINAHVWTNIDDYIEQVKYVSSQLQKLNPENKDKYASNEDTYVDKLEKLKADYSSQISSIEGKGVLVLDETLPSFCVFCKLNAHSIHTDHEQESLSADDLKDTIDDMKNDNVKAILIAKGSDKKNAEAIANETGAEIYELNSCMVGEETLDAYIEDMKENFEIISKIK